ncbi:MAG: Rv0340 family IniB-related protein [Mycobacterium sp.]
MANSLLDFVMSLVRDSDAAARYAADPAAALADANLPDVTSADVDQLIPVVTESFTSADPAISGFDAGAASGLDSNVWASGAATAAFDAFGIDDAVAVVAHELDGFAVREVLNTLPDDQSALPGALDDLVTDLDDTDIPVTAVDDVPVYDTPVDTPIDQDEPTPDATGFDVFD